MLRKTGDGAALFLNAATDYAENMVRGIDTLVVIPFWEEIEQFNEVARSTLRPLGILNSAEVVRDAARPLT